MRRNIHILWMIASKIQSLLLGISGRAGGGGEVVGGEKGGMFKKVTQCIRGQQEGSEI